MIWQKLSPSVALSRTGIDAVVEVYREQSGSQPISPTALIVSPLDLFRAYEIVRYMTGMEGLVVVAVPGMERDHYAAVGPHGLVANQTTY